MNKFSNPFSLKNPINQIVKEKVHVVEEIQKPKQQLPRVKRSETGKFFVIKEQPKKLDQKKVEDFVINSVSNLGFYNLKGKPGKFSGVNMNDDSPMSKLGCGGEGCVRKRGNEWVILNNKKAGYPVWRSGFKSEADAKNMLSAYHANS